MSMEINGAAILRAIAENPARFEMSEAQVNEIAVNVIKIKMTEKGISLANIRKIYSAMDRDDFVYIIESITEKDMRSIIKIDSKNPECKASDNLWAKIHIVRLASGEVDPFVPTAKVRKISKPAEPKKEKTPKIGKIMGSEAQAAATKVRKTRAKG